jgi:predicted RNA-binding protein with PUA-like domain
MKKDAKLAGMALLKQSRLSVVPLSKGEYDTIVRTAGC